MSSFVPGNPPYAAQALIIHETGLVLGVSRKDSHSDFGLPGGKVDPGESFGDAVIRETLEETGLSVVKMLPIYGNYCGRIPHWSMTFLCKVDGSIHSSEKGRIAWLPAIRLIENESGQLQSFGEYNRAVLKALVDSHRDKSEFITRIPLDPRFELYPDGLDDFYHA